ncbi:MAG: HNH endonuclease [Bacilli bacterium]|nr:HNH endonuclease [Bacilli bacterium]
MSKLYITDEFYNKLNDSKVVSVLSAYGYNRDSFLESVIKKLNDNYACLKIDGYELMPNDKKQVYSMYNGYVEGDFDEYDQFDVSFSDIRTKEGNTIISQQLMPLLQQKISSDLNYLYNKKVKRVFMLSSHKSSVINPVNNSIKEDSYGSTLQLLVKCLVTLGYDIYQLIPVTNLDTKTRLNSVSELVDNMNYIQSNNTGNLQHKKIVIEGNKVVGSFAQKPKGQDEKYFAIHYLTAIFLNSHNKYDVSQAYTISEQSNMMEMLFNFAAYVEKNDIILNADKPLTDDEFKKLIEKEDEVLEKLKSLAEKYGEEGTRIVTTAIRLSEVQDELRKRLIQKRGCKCELCKIQNEELLVASHIKPASLCDIYGKGDINNVLLLCANHDRLFDRCLISFSFIDGKIMISNKLTKDEIRDCNLNEDLCLPKELMTPETVEYLIWHNDEFTKKNGE